MKLIFLLEEKSMQTLLDIILPSILPPGIDIKTIPHSGKSDLQSSIPRKLKAWNEPDVKFAPASTPADIGGKKDRTFYGY